jgi:hypothetical protein
MLMIISHWLTYATLLTFVLWLCGSIPSIFVRKWRVGDGALLRTFTILWAFTLWVRCLAVLYTSWGITPVIVSTVALLLGLWAGGLRAMLYMGIITAAPLALILLGIHGQWLLIFKILLLGVACVGGRILGVRIINSAFPDVRQ